MSKKQRKLDNAGVDTLPQNTTIHQHGPNWAGVVFVAFCCLIIGGILLWYTLLYLLRQAGYYNPHKVLAVTILSILVIIPTIMVVGWLVERVAVSILDRLFDHRQTMVELQGELEHKKALVAQAPVPAQSRLTEEDAKFAALLKDVLGEAYRYRAKHGEYQHNDPRPWSRAQCVDRKLVTFGNAKPTWAMASKVRRWLTAKRLVRQDQLNVDQFPTLATAETVINDEFYLPVQVNRTGDTVPRLDTGNYVFTKS